MNNDPPFQVTGTGLVWEITQLWYLTSSGWNYIWGDWLYAWSSTGLVYGAWYDYNTGGAVNTDSFTVQPGYWVAARNWVYANGQWFAAWSDSTDGVPRIFCQTF